jgi:hypothetical protein
MAAAAAKAVRATRLLIRAGIVFSRLAIYFDQVSQVMRALASIGFIPWRETALLRVTNYD